MATKKTISTKEPKRKGGTTGGKGGNGEGPKGPSQPKFRQVILEESLPKWFMAHSKYKQIEYVGCGIIEDLEPFTGAVSAQLLLMLQDKIEVHGIQQKQFIKVDMPLFGYMNMDIENLGDIISKGSIVRTHIANRKIQHKFSKAVGEQPFPILEVNTLGDNPDGAGTVLVPLHWFAIPIEDKDFSMPEPDPDKYY